MKVEKVDVDKVKEKFASLKKKDEKPITDFGTNWLCHCIYSAEFEEKYDEEEKRRAEVDLKDKLKKKKKTTENERIEAQLDDLEAEIAADMGLPLSFGTSKKK